MKPRPGRPSSALSRCIGTFCQWVNEPTSSTVTGSRARPSGRRQRKILENVCGRSGEILCDVRGAEDGSRINGPPLGGRICANNLLNSLDIFCLKLQTSESQSIRSNEKRAGPEIKFPGESEFVNMDLSSTSFCWRRVDAT